MTETPTPDEIARWAALAESATPGPWIVKKDEWVLAVDEDGAPAVGQINVPTDAAFIAAAREIVPRLLALVAAQAEQNAELRADRDQADYVCRATGDKLAAVREQRDAARAELSALRATDEYQRWARAVTERDAARDAVARVVAVINDPARTWIIDTHNDDGTVDKRGREVVDSDDIRAALGAAT